MTIESYESAAEELNTLVKQLENDEISVDELAIKLERAAELIKYCREKLRTTEKKVATILDELKLE